MRKIKQVSCIMLVTTAFIIFTELVLDNVGLLEGFERSIADFDYTDLYYQHYIDPNEVSLDTNLVIINIGYLSRNEIAELIKSVNSYDPQVSVLNVFFITQKGKAQDSALASVLNQTKNLVLDGSLDETGKPIWSNSIFTGNATFGLNDFFIKDGVTGAPKTYSNYYDYMGNRYRHLSVEAVALFDTEKIESLNHQEEYIVYSGNHQYSRSSFNQRFSTLDHRELAYNNPRLEDLIKDKIVVYGFLGNTVNDQMNVEDKFHTPLNPNLFQRSHPDMYATVIHANIISSLLSGKVVKHNKVLSGLIQLFTVLILAFVFRWIYLKYEKNYHLVSKAIAFLLLNFFVLFAMALFGIWEIKIGLTYIIYSLIFVSDATEIIMKRFGY